MQSVDRPYLRQLEPSAGTRKRGNIRLNVVVFAGAALAEAALLAMYVTGTVSPLVFLIQHTLICLVIVLLLIEHAGQTDDTAAATIAALATIVGGPLGAASALLLSLSGERRRRSEGLDSSWRALLAGRQARDGSEILYEEVRDGRTVNRASGLPTRLEQVLRAGSLQDKQAALGAIATRYGPEFRSLLFEAVRHPSPPIRTQAAAVITKLRNHERHQFQDLVETSRSRTLDTKERLAVVRELVAIVQRDFLDRRQQVQAHQAIDELLDGLAKDRGGRDALRLERCRALIAARFHNHAVALLRAMAEDSETA